MPSPALLGGHAPREDLALPLPYDALAYSSSATIMMTSARFLTSSLGANPSMRFSALSSPRTGLRDSFDTSRFSEAQPAFASSAMPPSRRSTDSVDGNVWTTLVLRLSSQFMRSCTLLVRILMRCSRGNDRYASASTSASSSTREASGAKEASSSTASW